MRRMLRRLIGEDRAQDVIEYALAGALIGIIGIVAWANITEGIGEAYQGWDTGIQDLWEPDDPAGP